LSGRVSVNGEIITTLGTKVEEGDKVTFDKVIVEIEEEKVYYLLHKPEGYITSVQDEKGRNTVLDLIQDKTHRIFPVGRLDYNTSGLLLLTNDGELTYALTHPKHEVTKTYIAVVEGTPTEQALNQLRDGVIIENYKTSKAKVKKVKQSKHTTTLSLVIHEGKNRQVRKMCEAVGHRVVHLERIAIGNIELEDLEKGEYRKLSSKELLYLKKIAGLL
jgi:pseudouridine synthase